MAEWLTIEVFDGDLPASQWRESHGEALLLSALTKWRNRLDLARTPLGRRARARVRR